MDELHSVLLGVRPRRRQYEGPQPARVVRASAAGLFVALEATPSVEHKASWSRDKAHTHTVSGTTSSTADVGFPPVGTRCLVLFAGAGIADPWVVQFASWPA